VVEHHNQTMVDMAHCMLKSKHLPGFFWGEAVSTTVFILNHALMKALIGLTPFESWHGEAPTVHYLHTFGCLAHVKVTRPGHMKLEDQSKKTILIGYEPGSKAYQCYDPTTKHIIISRDVIFDEAGAWRWDDTKRDVVSTIKPFSLEYETEVIHDVAPASPPPTPQQAPTSPHVGELALEEAPQLDINEEDLDAEHDDTPPVVPCH
jgi:hypothetical protein